MRIDVNKPKRMYAHRLVAQYYLNNGQAIEDGLEVNHIDGNKLNNNYINLEIVTPKQNGKHAWDNHLKPMKTIYQFDKNFNIINSFYNVKETCKNTQVSRNNLILELNSKYKRLLNNQWYFSYNSTLSTEDVKEYPNTGKAKKVLQYDLKGNFIREYESCGDAKKLIFQI